MDGALCEWRLNDSVHQKALETFVHTVRPRHQRHTRTGLEGDVNSIV